MRRTSPIPKTEWDAVYLQLETKYEDAYSGPQDSFGFEDKIESCGYLSGKPVIIDYGD